MVMLFGVINNTLVVFDYMNTIFQLYFDKFVVFNDDILIYFESTEKQEVQFKIFLQMLKNNSLIVKLLKCKI